MQGELQPGRAAVYHLFGKPSEPDYSSCRKTTTSNGFGPGSTSATPRCCRAASATCPHQAGAAVLGYELDDWDFRVLFQGIKSFGGNVLMRKRPHVGVQLSPEMQSIEPESAQEYSSRTSARTT